MRLPTGQLLGYCTNVHAYTDLPGLLATLGEEPAALRKSLVARGALDPDARLGVGLWLPAAVARAVAVDPAPLRERLAELLLDAFTVNAFPHGDFHGARVKDAVFRPRWDEPERLSFTLDAAEALAALLPEGAVGSLSTHTGSYKPWGVDEAQIDAIARGFLQAAAGLATLEERTGRRIVLALEPEPLSLLETTDEVVSFFTDRLHPGGEAARRHLGLCFDACHQAVEFEAMEQAVAALGEAGITIAKVQLSSAIRVEDPAAAREVLLPWADDRWFHQVVARDADGRRVRWADLPEALSDERAAAVGPWRIHFHVPLFTETLDEEGLLATTRPDLSRLLRVVGRAAVTPHLEIETYSYGMIPESRRRAMGAGTLGECLEREFAWVLKELGAEADGQR